MFPRRFFPTRYFPTRYFPKTGLSWYPVKSFALALRRSVVVSQSIRRAYALARAVRRMLDLETEL